MKFPYYFAANSFEGCGHRHRKIKTAAQCARKMNDWYGAWGRRRSAGVYLAKHFLSKRSPATKVLDVK
jgi:hypothetical protein